jgi:hypothetical protein
MCVFVCNLALVTLQVNYIFFESYDILACGLPGGAMFFPHYLINGMTVGEKVTEHKKCILISSATFV